MFHKPEIAQFIDQAQKGILAEVVFGNPQTDCRNLGVCKMHIGPKAVALPNELKTKACGCPTTIAFIRKGQGETLHVHFLNYSLKPAYLKKYFPGDRFVVEAKFPLPEALCRALGLGESKFYIQPGHYPSLNDGLYHTVSVSLGKS